MTDKCCPVCGNTIWNPFLKIDSGRIMTGDQRIVGGVLEKEVCANCGIATNAQKFTSTELENLYGYEYILNTLGKEEHHFFTESGMCSRSQVIFDWIKPWLPENFSSLLEIGCGEGNLLDRIKKAFDGKEITGIEGSRRACELALKKDLNVRCQMVLSDNDTVPEADVIINVAVLEHVEDIIGFISVLKKGVKKGGRIIFCVPIQNYPGYDIFFAEHVWHLTTNQFVALFHANGLRCIHVDDSHPINQGMAMFVCEKNEDIAPKLDIIKETSYVKDNRNTWLKAFDGINKWTADNKRKNIALFGSGEVATLFLTFTDLSILKIKAIIDEDPGKINTTKHGIPVVDLSWPDLKKVDSVLVAVNPRYHENIKGRLAAKGFEVKVWDLKE